MSGKLPTGLKIVSMERQTAQVRMRAPFAAAGISASEKLTELLRTANLWRQNTQVNKSDNFNFEKVADILPKDEEYISVNFRALSKTIVPGHWIDWSKDNVLKDSVSMLLGATVYPNHDFSDINNWLGSVSNVAWDETGANAEGVPGINATYKIDALMNPRIARGLLMTPPAIHSTSMTVLFKFEPSHPDIFNESRWRFCELLGEEVEGQIVRLIVTEILEYWEASLVFQGADRLAKKYDEDEEEDFENLSAAGLSALPANSNEEKTMKLSKEQKAELGIEFDGDEVPETEILKAAESLAAKTKQFDGVDIANLKKQASQVETLLVAKRAEVTRLARLAELGAEEGELEEIISQQIEEADAEKLVKLEAYFGKKAADKFPTGRSSQEDSQQIENAGGVSQAAVTVPTVGLHD
jgi:hypothetical protein